MSAPLQRTIEANVPAVATAVDDDTVLAQAPYAGRAISVEYVPEAAITGAATNNRTVSVVNRGQDGTGTAVVATLTFASGTNAAASDDVNLTLGTGVNIEVAEGDTLAWRSVHNGTGIADPGGLARLVVDRT